MYTAPFLVLSVRNSEINNFQKKVFGEKNKQQQN